MAMAESQQHTGPFATAVNAYRHKGWRGTVPLPAGAKWPPPPGYTGAGGIEPTDAIIGTWTKSPHRAGGNIAIRLPDGVIGIDADLYKPEGRASWDELTRTLPPLPPTWRSTSRTDGSGISLYQVNKGMVLSANPRPGVEIIQHHHRFCVVAPSIHPDGPTYQWYGPDGEPIELDDIPYVDQLPFLPAAWVEALRPEDAPTRSIDTAKRTSTSGIDLADIMLHPRADGDSIAKMIAESYVFEEALIADGWSVHHRKGADVYLTRPGKRVKDGHSAVLHDGTVLVVFTADASCSHLFRSGKRTKDGAGYALNRFDYVVATRGNGDRSETCRIAREQRNAANVNEWLLRSSSDVASAFEEPDMPDAPVDRAGIDWGEPLPLGGVIDPLPPFPVHALPIWMQDYVNEVAATRQVPCDLPAASGLGAAVSVVTGRLQVAPNPETDDREPICIYICAVIHSGGGKSPTDAAMTRPVRDAERAAQEQWDDPRGPAQMAKLKAERAETTARTAREQQLKSDSIGISGMRGDVVISDSEIATYTAEAQLARSLVPPRPRVIVDDVTPEQLVKLLERHGGRLSFMSPEAALMDQATGQYARNGANLDVFLKGWGGEELRVDRKGGEDGGTEIKVRAYLSVSIGGQPSVVAKLGEDKQAKGRGLVQRFMWFWPQSMVGTRDRASRFLTARDTLYGGVYYDRMREFADRMLGIPAGTVHTVHLGRDARLLFAGWVSSIEPQLRDGGELEHMREAEAKLTASTIRLAGLLHVLDGNPIEAEVDGYTAARAIVIGNYWMAHGRAVWARQAPSEGLEQARKVAVRLAEWAGGDVTFAELWKGLRKSFTSPEVLAAAVQTVLDRGWLQRLDDGPALVAAVGRGKKSPRFVVHPSIHSMSVPVHSFLGVDSYRCTHGHHAGLCPVCEGMSVLSGLSVPIGITHAIGDSLTHSLTHKGSLGSFSALSALSSDASLMTTESENSFEVSTEEFGVDDDL